MRPFGLTRTPPEPALIFKNGCTRSGAPGPFLRPFCARAPPEHHHQHPMSKEEEEKTISASEALAKHLALKRPSKLYDLFDPPYVGGCSARDGKSKRNVGREGLVFRCRR